MSTFGWLLRDEKTDAAGKLITLQNYSVTDHFLMLLLSLILHTLAFLVYAKYDAKKKAAELNELVSKFKA